jgi:RsiW-degrading membrane proteinase PrsW (M82 family)
MSPGSVPNAFDRRPGRPAAGGGLGRGDGGKTAVAGAVSEAGSPATVPAPEIHSSRSASGRAPWWRRLAWLLVLAVGLALYLLVLQALVSTGNPNFVPSAILLGACVVPAAFVTYAAGRGGWQTPGGLLAAAVLFGGVIGTVVAGWLEYDTLRTLGVLPMGLVGLIEESAKLLVPVAIGLWWWRRRRVPADGLVVGVAVGTGFAALETMGYAFVALIASQGNIGEVEVLLLVRGLLSPAGHAAWTGLVCAALWRAVAGPSVRTIAAVAATFAAVVVLHASWDSLGGLIGYLAVGLFSVGWLLWEFHRTNRPSRQDRPTRPAPAAPRPSALAAPG